jgi:hypothetical protein
MTQEQIDRLDDEFHATITELAKVIAEIQDDDNMDTIRSCGRCVSLARKLVEIDEALTKAGDEALANGAGDCCYEHYAG